MQFSGYVERDFDKGTISLACQEKSGKIVANMNIVNSLSARFIVYN